MRRHETPQKRINPSGATAWLARWTDRKGKRRYGFPPTIPGTYRLKRDAQDAILACYELDETGPANPSTVGGYFATWTQTHPHAKVTDRTNECRVRAVLDIVIDGAPLRDWPFEQLRYRHAAVLVDHMLREQGRAYTGAQNIIRTLSKMTKDAIRDEVAVTNPFRDVEIRANDPRIQKARRPVRVWSWEQMHAFAAACARGDRGGDEIAAWRATYAEPMVRTLTDCGLRAGELLALCLCDLDLKAGLLEVRWTTSLGEMLPGTKTDHGELEAGRVVPIPAALCAMLDGMPKRIDAVVDRGDSRERLLFPSPRGRLWFYTGWHRDVWVPGRRVAGIDMRPHECRHSYVSLLRAAGVDPADLADAAGHTVETATRKYTHGLGRSFEAIRGAVGA